MGLVGFPYRIKVEEGESPGLGSLEWQKDGFAINALGETVAWMRRFKHPLRPDLTPIDHGRGCVAASAFTVGYHNKEANTQYIHKLIYLSVLC